MKRKMLGVLYINDEGKVEAFGPDANPVAYEEIFGAPEHADQDDVAEAARRAATGLVQAFGKPYEQDEIWWLTDVKF